MLYCGNDEMWYGAVGRWVARLYPRLLGSKGGCSAWQCGNAGVDGAATAQSSACSLRGVTSGMEKLPDDTSSTYQ